MSGNYDIVDGDNCEDNMKYNATAGLFRCSAHGTVEGRGLNPKELGVKCKEKKS